MLQITAQQAQAMRVKLAELKALELSSTPAYKAVMVELDKIEEGRYSALVGLSDDEYKKEAVKWRELYNMAQKELNAVFTCHNAQERALYTALEEYDKQVAVELALSLIA